MSGRTVKAGLQETLGYRFKDAQLLKTALTHRSRSYEMGARPSVSYERLEFLGDALLGFIVADRLYRTDATASEGVLTRRRQAVVRMRTLASVSASLGLGDAVLLGRGEERTGGRGKHSLLADTFEAVLGAIYLDGGIRPARAFVRRHLRDILRQTRHAANADDDYKTRLQEEVQAKLQVTPRYRIVSTSGPPHAREFAVQVMVGRRVLGKGKGSNRKSAEQKAAREALERYGESKDLS